MTRYEIVPLVFMLVVIGAIGWLAVHESRERDQREAWCAQHTQDMRCAGLWR